MKVGSSERQEGRTGSDHLRPIASRISFEFTQNLSGRLSPCLELDTAECAHVVAMSGLEPSGQPKLVRVALSHISDLEYADFTGVPRRCGRRGGMPERRAATSARSARCNGARQHRVDAERDQRRAPCTVTAPAQPAMPRLSVVLICPRLACRSRAAVAAVLR